MQLYHLVDQNTISDILKTGLKYGSSGRHSHDTHAAKTNTFLDTHRPERLQAKHVSRIACLYMYLALDGKVHDITDGTRQEAHAWAAKQPQAVLTAAVNPSMAYLSDLDVYDELAQAIVSQATAQKRQALAERYWHSVWPLDHILQYYRLHDDHLAVRPQSPKDLPQRFGRVEVMVTCDIPPEHISVFADQV